MERDNASHISTFCIKPFERQRLTYRAKTSEPLCQAQQTHVSPETVPLYATARIAPQIDDEGKTRWELPTPVTQTTISEIDLKAQLVKRFDEHKARIGQLKASLRTREPSSQDQGLLPTRVAGNQSVFPTFLLPGTLEQLDRIAHPPLLPARLAHFFERDFRRVEAMFHTVFYRKYHPEVLADAKQQAFLGLYKKWLKNRNLLTQSAAYIVTAAVYSVSNWRQKSQEVRANEGTLLIDSHGKVMGHTAVHGTDRWTDRLDFRFDLAKAVDVVLYQYAGETDYRETHAVMQDILDEVRFQQGQNALGVKRGQYMKKRNALKSALREQLIDYSHQ